MDNQHRKIKGYRDLSAREIELMNAIKEAGTNIETLIRIVGDALNARMDELRKTIASDDVDNASLAIASAERDRITAAQPGRWLSIAKTDFQTGLMALTRAVAQPGSF